MAEETAIQNPEDVAEKQGVHALSRGYLVRPSERAVEILFPPSRFAEAVFALTPRTEKRGLFNNLLARIDASSDEASRYPGIAAWMEEVSSQ